MASTVDVDVDGAKSAYLCRKYGISEGTFYNSKPKLGGMTVSEAKRLKTLEDGQREPRRVCRRLIFVSYAAKVLLSRAS